MLLHVRSELLGWLWSEKLGSALAVVISGLGLADAPIAPELSALGRIRYGLLFFCLSIGRNDGQCISSRYLQQQLLFSTDGDQVAAVAMALSKEVSLFLSNRTIGRYSNHMFYTILDYRPVAGSAIETRKKHRGQRQTTSRSSTDIEARPVWYCFSVTESGYTRSNHTTRSEGRMGAEMAA